ncbi:MAG TPA: metallophosphoesterase [Thermoflexales bacterium]|nr:metallophosphoesterase [Thermoflexales bacterium]
MFSRAGESKLIREVIFPLIERLVDIVFASTLVLAPAFLALAGFFLFQGNFAPAALFLLMALAAGVGVYARVVAPYRLRARAWRVSGGRAEPQNLASLPAPTTRIVFFTDLHLGKRKRAAWAQKVVALVNSFQPDVILVGGDFVEHPGDRKVEDLLAPLARLNAPHKLAVFGNHDHGQPGTDRTALLTNLLCSYGIRPLVNECAHITVGQTAINVIGPDEHWVGKADLPRSFAACATPAAVSIVLGHNPDALAALPADAPSPAPEQTLWLFGHTHAGQIYLPFAPGLGVPITSQFWRGWFNTPRGLVYVSSGCGEADTPVRLGTLPEIVVLDLNV